MSLQINYPKTAVLFSKSYGLGKLLLLFMLVFGSKLNAQSLKGFIYDNENVAVPGANIFNPSAGTHTHSNINGSFKLDKVTPGDTIQIIFLGFENKTIRINSLSDTLMVKLKPELISLDAVVVSPGIDALNLFTDIDIRVNPVSSSQDILRQVPGLVIGQHAGGGKAEQIFLRGFDIDHGTDISISVDGLPVNMVSHAHGQGYADLHFVIPETVEKIDFGKGPYNTEKGNFATAGFVDYRIKDKFDQSLIKLEVGQFNTQRLLGVLNVLDKEQHNLYLASEFITTDGPFESPQDFNRINFLTRYSTRLANSDKLTASASYFSSKWDASGQIPQRAVDDGSISRFGAIDDTEGGNTSRTNLWVNYQKNLTDRSYIENTAYFTRYDFELYSNFTFFLVDSINGDQIKQKEDRSIYGITSKYVSSFSGNSISGRWSAGISLRHDQSLDNELSRTANRQETLEQIQFGDIFETNMGAFLDASLEIGKWTINPGIRLDHFKFNYVNSLPGPYDPISVDRSILSPKLNLLYTYNRSLQLYLKAGRGFHSNDTRVATAQTGEEILPAAYSADLGFIWKPASNILINAALWNLFLEQEFVYVGDAGIVEPSGRTNRQGIDLSLRYQTSKWLFWNFDANYVYARSLDEEEGQDFIPLAPDLTLSAGLNAIHPSGFYGGIKARYLDDRAANEDNSIVAEGYAVIDLNAGYQIGNFDIGFQIQNLFDTDWNETQFATESRLRNESAPVEEIHFTPGTPFFLKGIISYRF